MGFFTWLTGTGRKSAAAALLQAYYEICQRHGAFRGNPGRFANQVIEKACCKLPGIEQAGYKPYVLALACLTAVMVDESSRSEEANLYVMGMTAMLQAIDADASFRPSMAEARIIEASAAVLTEWANRPSPWLSGLNLGGDLTDNHHVDAGPVTTAPPPGWRLDASQSDLDRERARAELVRRMQQSGIKPLT